MNKVTRVSTAFISFAWSAVLVSCLIAAPAQAQDGPAKLRIGDQRIPAPTAPSGFIRITVPAIVYQPAAIYTTSPNSEAMRHNLEHEVPTPLRIGPQKAIVADTEAQGANEPDGLRSDGLLGDSVGEPGDISVGSPEAAFAPAFSTTFDSLDFDDNPANTSGFVFIPPDPHGAAGPTHVLNVTNVSMQIHTKAGAEVLGTTGILLESFFASLTPADFLFDPKAIYDQHSGRFLVVALEQVDSMGTKTSRILVAVSDDSDPTDGMGALGTWHFTAIDSKVTIGPSHWADYPGFAVDEEAVYITANMFAFGSGNFGGVRLWIIDKGVSSGFYSGAVASVSITDPYGGGGAAIAATTQPAHVYGTAPTSPENVGTFLVSYSGVSDGTDEFVQIVRVDDPLTGTPTFTQQLVSVGDIEALTSGLADAPQLGTTEKIEVNDRRALDAVWRDDSLWFTTTIDPTGTADAGQATAHWFELDTSTLASVSLTDQGNIGGEDIATDTWTFFPSIAVNSGNDVVIGFAASAASIFPGSYYTSRLAIDPAGTTSGSSELRAGLDIYIRTFGGPRNRWGDYSATALDPVDGGFWVYNQHAITQGTVIDGEDGRWGTAWGRSYICDETLDLTASEWKQISMVCNPGTADTVDDVFGDDLAGNYEFDWVVRKRDAAAQTYVTLATTDALGIGEGYWIVSVLAEQSVNIKGASNAVTDVPLVGVTAAPPGGCASSAGRCNKTGHPHNYDVCWSSVEVIDGGSPLSLAAADPGGICQTTGGPMCVMSRIAHKWTGAGYAPFDGATMGMKGTLVPWDGFWVSANKSDISLRVPATPATASCETGMAAPASASAAAASSATDLSGQATNGNASRSGMGSGQSDWFIRLIATSRDLVDRNNVFGQLSDSMEGYDSHDLLELDPDLGDHLTIVFPHPEWDVNAGNYASDYRSFRHRINRWDFEVHSSDPVAQVVLSWESVANKLRNSVLTDRETHRRIHPRTDGSYVFNMNGNSRAFTWIVSR